MAKKKKLTKGQVRRVRSNQKKRLKQEESVQWDESMLGGTAKAGLVITRFGQHADIEDVETNEIHRCNYAVASKAWFLATELSGVPGLNLWQAFQVSLKRLSHVPLCLLALITTTV